MENVLDLVRNNKLSMNGNIFDTLFKCLDALEAMVQDVIDGGMGKGEVTELVERLSQLSKVTTAVMEQKEALKLLAKVFLPHWYWINTNYPF